MRSQFVVERCGSRVSAPSGLASRLAKIPSVVTALVWPLHSSSCPVLNRSLELASSVVKMMTRRRRSATSRTPPAGPASTSDPTTSAPPSFSHSPRKLLVVHRACTGTAGRQMMPYVMPLLASASPATSNFVPRRLHFLRPWLAKRKRRETQLESPATVAYPAAAASSSLPMLSLSSPPAGISSSSSAAGPAMEHWGDFDESMQPTDEAVSPSPSPVEALTNAGHFLDRWLLPEPLLPLPLPARVPLFLLLQLLWPDLFPRTCCRPRSASERVSPCWLSVT